jgi:hypothetical protein
MKRVKWIPALLISLMAVSAFAEISEECVATINANPINYYGNGIAYSRFVTYSITGKVEKNTLNIQSNEGFNKILDIDMTNLVISGQQGTVMPSYGVDNCVANPQDCQNDVQYVLGWLKVAKSRLVKNTIEQNQSIACIETAVNEVAARVRSEIQQLRNIQGQ